MIGSPATVVSGNRIGPIDHGVEDPVAEGLDHPSQHFATMGGAAVEHGGKDSIKF